MFHVDSEVGRLRQVIVHRPGLELKRLTPDNAAELLFDDLPQPADLGIDVKHEHPPVAG